MKTLYQDFHSAAIAFFEVEETVKLHHAVTNETGVLPKYIGFLRHKDKLEKSLEHETRHQPTDSKWDYLHSRETPIRILVVIHKNHIVALHEVKGVARVYPSEEEKWDTIKEYDLRNLDSQLTGTQIMGWPNQRHSIARYRMPMFHQVEVEYIPLANYFPEEVRDDVYEGAKKTVTVNAYERNAEARVKCIEHFREKDGVIRCQACHMSFLERYGVIGKEFIHVHHVVPLHKIAATYRVKPEEDLIPVCPNCHAMLHTSDPPLGIGDLAARIRR